MSNGAWLKSRMPGERRQVNAATPHRNIANFRCVILSEMTSVRRCGNFARGGGEASIMCNFHVSLYFGMKNSLKESVLIETKGDFVIIHDLECAGVSCFLSMSRF